MPENNDSISFSGVVSATDVSTATADNNLGEILQLFVLELNTVAGLIELLVVVRDWVVMEVGRRGRRQVLRASNSDEPVRKLERRSISWSFVVKSIFGEWENG